MEKKNVLMITADQWPGLFLGCGGRKDIMTPTLDYLAKNGMYPGKENFDDRDVA